MIKSLIITIVGVVVPFVLWYAVQQLWNRVFFGTEEESCDALSSRTTCGSCAIGGKCLKNKESHHHL